MTKDTLITLCNNYYLFSLGQGVEDEDEVKQTIPSGVEGVDYLNFDGSIITRDQLNRMYNNNNNPEEYKKIVSMFFTDNQPLRDSLSDQIKEIDQVLRYCGTESKYAKLVDDLVQFKQYLEQGGLALGRANLSVNNLFQLYKLFGVIKDSRLQLREDMKQYGIKVTRDGVVGIDSTSDQVGKSGKVGRYIIAPGLESNVVRLLTESGELGKMLGDIMGIYGMRPVGINLVIKDFGNWLRRKLPTGKIEVVMKVGDIELNKAVSEEMTGKYFIKFCDLITEYPHRLLLANFTWNIKLM